MPHQFTFSAAMAFVTFATTVMAQTFDDDVFINGDLCIGEACLNGSFNPNYNELRITGGEKAILFDDPSTGPSDEWRLIVGGGGSASFELEQGGSDTRPFRIFGNNTQDILVISSEDVGFGTAFPEQDLHILKPNNPNIRFQESGSTMQAWEAGMIGSAFRVRDMSANRTPLLVQAGARSFAMTLASNGNVGIGTESPDAPFELSSEEGFNFFRISALGALNDSVDITYTSGPLNTGQLRYNIVDGDNQEMSLDADGNMVIDGTLTTGGPTCAGGCDRVFEAGFPLPSIEDRTEMMLSLGHLPAIGPTTPDAPLNVTEKLAGVINELEHAHLYIAQLKAENLATQARLTEEITALSARLEAVEAQ